ncbi:Methyl-accepting chemotaxis protein (MCP) signalling domain-containing protein [Sulfidibacter corallicola]|uniref:Methyl-accepting chemotaxis protein n=1 Tax=Sulfidibacter corallicola TaxID=2818388 RepID=A0A8A4TIC8_SULCO|nr:protoglobin domain-containing protein [Sulfidibacter corallicola]QTD49373.1 hypothetical protein J3U87_27630 [Sulfidibacter corallicola]
MLGFFRSKKKTERVIEPGIIRVKNPDIMIRVRYQRLTERDLGIIAYWYHQVEEDLDVVIDRFYDNLLSIKETKTILETHSTVQRQRPLLKRYLESMFSGVIDDNYVAYRQQIGDRHDYIKLETFWYVGQYEIIREALTSLVADKGATPQELIQFMASFGKLCHFDMSLVLEALAQSRLAKINAMAEESNLFIDEMAAVFQKLAKRDLTVRLTVDEKSKFESIVREFNVALDVLDQTFSSLFGHAKEQYTTGASTVAAAIGEMTTTIGELSRQGETARAVTGDTVVNIRETVSQMEVLTKASSNIDNITNIIVQIAEQTKLLSLNATIEAARSGEAGKGFAVVAGEVKELARQTNISIQQIRELIGSIQTSTKHVGSGIQNVNKVIQEIDGIVSGTASATTEMDVSVKQLRAHAQQSAEEAAALTELLGEFKLTRRS